MPFSDTICWPDEPQRILVVEADEASREAAHQTLGLLGAVTLVSNFDEAVCVLSPEEGPTWDACMIGVGENFPNPERLALFAFKQLVTAVVILAEEGSVQAANCAILFGDEPIDLGAALGAPFLRYFPSKDWLAAWKACSGEDELVEG